MPNYNPMYVIVSDELIAPVESLSMVRSLCGVEQNRRLRELIETKVIKLYSFDYSTYLKQLPNKLISKCTHITTYGNTYSKNAFFALYKTYFYIGHTDDFLVLKYVDKHNLTKFAVLHKV